MNNFQHWSRFVNVPLMIAPGRAEVIMQALSKGDEGLPDLEALSDLSVPKRYRPESSDGIGLIPIQGVLMHRSSRWSWYFGETSYDDIRAQFAEALEDPSVKTILLDIDSPGGEVSGVFDLVDDIYQARGTKPIYAIANESAYSAAYALASAADKVFLPRTAGIGSIGVIAVHLDQSGFDSKLGVKYTPIFAGARKNDFSQHEPISDKAKQTTQDQINEVYDIFVETVARNRGISADVVRGTEAEFYQGAGAKVGLADGVMNFGELIVSINNENGGKAVLFNKQTAQVETPEAQAVTEQTQEADVSAKTVINIDQVKSEAYHQGIADERKRMTDIREALAAVSQHMPAGIADGLTDQLIESGLSVDLARKQIITALSAGQQQAEITSTVSPLSTGEINPVLAEAKRRAQAAQKGV